ncbi:Mif2/CENP-C like-domain-containing protein, partial [Mycena galopus ATCC 62051]
MSRAAGEFMQTTAEVARHQAEEQAGQRVGQAMSGLFRSFTQVLGGANTAQADTAATSAPWLPPPAQFPLSPRAAAHVQTNRRRRPSARPTSTQITLRRGGMTTQTRPRSCGTTHSRKTVTRRVAFTAKMFTPAPAKIFGDGDFMAAGQLVIPEGKRKPGEGTNDNTYIFFVVEGAVNVMIHDTSVVIATGGMFMVPRGNSYCIENIAERPRSSSSRRRAYARRREEELAPPRG